MVGIYKITNKINGKCYVGQTKDHEYRWYCHKSEGYRGAEPNKALYKSIEKHGIENFEFEMIEECKEDELDLKEFYWITELDSYRKGYNMTDGNPDVNFGQYDKKEISDETRKILSKQSKERYEQKNALWRINNLGLNKEKLQLCNEKRKKKFICNETGIVYESIRGFSKEFNVDRRQLVRHLNREKNFNSVKGKTYSLI